MQLAAQTRFEEDQAVHAVVNKAMEGGHQRAGTTTAAHGCAWEYALKL